MARWRSRVSHHHRNDETGIGGEGEEAVEDDLNELSDRLAAVMIELQQKEDEVEVNLKEIEDLVAEHQRIIEVVERGEVEEARVHVGNGKNPAQQTTDRQNSSHIGLQMPTYLYGREFTSMRLQALRQGLNAER